jgi:hypothetical protein
VPCQENTKGIPLDINCIHYFDNYDKNQQRPYNSYTRQDKGTAAAREEAAAAARE